MQTKQQPEKTKKNMKTEKKLAVWRPLKVGQHVRLNTYKKGSHGIVKERLDKVFSGLGRYGIILEHDLNNTADFCRYELSAIRIMKQFKRRRAAGKIELPKDATLEELRSRRDLAQIDGDIKLAFACALAIDKKRGI